MRHTRNLALLVLLIGFTLSAAGCAVLEKTPTDEPTPRVVVTRMTALYIGPLTIVDGCLRLGDGEDDDLVVWPPDFDVSIENNIIRVLYDDREVKVRLGEVVRLGGGQVKSIDSFDEATRLQIPAGCPGPYWLVGSISPVGEARPAGSLPDLAGTEWVLALLNGNSPIEDTQTSLRFEREFLTGSMGCNGYGGGPDSGKYAATDDGALTVFQPLAVTAQLCSEPEDVMEQEAAYIKALQNAAAYRVIGDRLEILDASGDTTLIFARGE